MRIIRSLLASAAVLWLAFAPAWAEEPALSKRDVERIVRDYILANPEIVEKALYALEAKRREEEKAKQVAAIEQRREQIFHSEHQAVLGNPDGKVTLVEFFDYNCGYCKRALADMTALIDSNPDLRVVLKEFPILSEGSLEAARISVAVKDVAPDRYLDFHTEMLTRPGAANGAKGMEVARDLGLDVAALEAAAEGPSVMANLLEVQELANALGMSGTPSYVVGNSAVFGAVGFDALQDKLAEARQACTTAAC